MSTPSPARREAGSLPSLYAIFVDWARTDGRTWIYLFKALTVAFLAIGIAMRLEMPQPRTAGRPAPYEHFRASARHQSNRGSRGWRRGRRL
jgi:hypothetical protein